MQSWIEQFAQAVSAWVATNLQPAASVLEHYVWAWPEDPLPPLLVVILVGAGIFVTTRLGFVQVRGFKHAIDITRGKYDDPNDEGDLKHYQALTTALSATVGIGNIAGVAIAVRMGGPGALFWMWVTAFFGMALKYAESTLGLKYREVHEDGSVSGGPMYYIEKGMGKNWKWMAIFFAACVVICSFGSGNMNQSNTMAEVMESDFGVAKVWTALFFAAIVAAVIIGGIRRIGKVTSILAPGMASLYVLGAMVILVMNIETVPGALATIVSEAFNPSATVGGGVASFMLTLMWGIRRGLFSNEAGQGSAPIAHATAKTDEPVREGLVASLGPFIDTLVICTMTGLVIITTGAWKDRVEETRPVTSYEALLEANAQDAQLLELREAREAGSAPVTVAVEQGQVSGATFVVLNAVVENALLLDANDQPWSGSLAINPGGGISVASGDGVPNLRGDSLLTGAVLTQHGFKKGLGLGSLGGWLVTLAVLLFAVSTAISWSYYGDRGIEYLLGAKAIPIYRWVFVFFFFLGAILPLQAVWTIGDVALGLMSFPNLIALFALSGVVVKMTKDYFSREHKPYR